VGLSINNYVLYTVRVECWRKDLPPLKNQSRSANSRPKVKKTEKRQCKRERTSPVEVEREQLVSRVEYISSVSPSLSPCTYCVRVVCLRRRGRRSKPPLAEIQKRKMLMASHRHRSCAKIYFSTRRPRLAGSGSKK